MMIYNHHPGAWGWIGMSLSMLAFWGLLIGVVVVAVRCLTRPASPTATASAEQVLAERFARGDIDVAEYQQRLQTLRARTP